MIQLTKKVVIKLGHFVGQFVFTIMIHFNVADIMSDITMRYVLA